MTSGPCPRVPGMRGRHWQKCLSSLAYGMEAFFLQIYPEEAEVLVSPSLAVACYHGGNAMIQRRAVG